MTATKSAKAERNGHVGNGQLSNGPAAQYEPALNVEQIVLSGKNPRKHFDEAKLQELADSIKAKGVLEPILVRRENFSAALGRSMRQPVGKRTRGIFEENYELVAGERRLRATKLAGLTTIPALIKEMTDKEAVKLLALPENGRKGSRLHRRGPGRSDPQIEAMSWAVAAPRASCPIATPRPSWNRFT